MVMAVVRKMSTMTNIMIVYVIRDPATTDYDVYAGDGDDEDCASYSDYTRLMISVIIFEKMVMMMLTAMILMLISMILNVVLGMNDDPNEGWGVQHHYIKLHASPSHGERTQSWRQAAEPPTPTSQG